MINLLGNAIKFAKGAINVSVSLLKREEENVTVEIKVTDSGIGIPN
jgi:signal transduction histidine kinase